MCVAIVAVFVSHFQFTKVFHDTFNFNVFVPFVTLVSLLTNVVVNPGILPANSSKVHPVYVSPFSNTFSAALPVSVFTSFTIALLATEVPS